MQGRKQDCAGSLFQNVRFHRNFLHPDHVRKCRFYRNNCGENQKRKGANAKGSLLCELHIGDTVKNIDSSVRYKVAAIENDIGTFMSRKCRCFFKERGRVYFKTTFFLLTI